jgi:hypothetical protein
MPFSDGAVSELHAASAYVANRRPRKCATMYRRDGEYWESTAPLRRADTGALERR